MKASRTALTLLLLAWLAFAVSFFLTAYSTERENYSGWEAFRAALDGGAFPVISACTNFLIPLSLGALLVRRPWVLDMYLVLMASALLLNTWWFVGYPTERDGLSVGYYLWVASYLLLVLGLLTWLRASAFKGAGREQDRP